MNHVYHCAQILTQAARDQALRMDVPMVIALTDQDGALVHFLRMPGALPASRAIAVDKAYTAATLRMPTHEVGRLAQPGEMLYGIQHSVEGRVVLFGGGYPLRWRDQVVGAVGISGGTVPEDMKVVTRVLQAWEDILLLASALLEHLPQGIQKEGVETVVEICRLLVEQGEITPKQQENVAAAVAICADVRCI
ncbi:GlcG/HbpS family heme-binding protein [Desulfogranum japonicum]|uniref:GlcG/HbpS family heme-binding protein n=1 Tax=Desulfogranum japonicum TaxID=231447 RepID=UPI000408DD23|nr:heme-binding protein [Desulfogranum japonicum]